MVPPKKGALEESNEAEQSPDGELKRQEPNGIFTEVEQRKSERRHDTAGTYAKRWAAKEACSKALGTGLRMGIAWKDMAVSNLRTGQPVMHVTGWAADRLAQMTPPGHEAIIHVTLTDDHPWAQAFVVIEARPLAPPIA